MAPLLAMGGLELFFAFGVVVGVSADHGARMLGWTARTRFSARATTRHCGNEYM
jgi:hypothetical protein